MSTGSPNGSPIGRRALLSGMARTAGAAGAAGAAGLAGALGPAARAAAASRAAPAAPPALAASPSGGRYPSNWPDLQPYGLADTRTDLWPREDNSFVLPLEPRPRDEELGRVWMRDFYVNCFRIAGRRPLYVATGTTRVPGLDTAGPWNDGIFVWTAPSLRPSPTWRACTSSSTAASTSCCRPRGTAPRRRPTAAPGTPTTRPPPAVPSTSTTRSPPSPTASRARTPTAGPWGWAPATPTSSRTPAAGCGRPSSATRTSATGPTRRGSPTPRCPAWTGPQGDRLYVQRQSRGLHLEGTL